eukprot:scaffold462_cov195-Pinguiococcus_pyrenoidosus.AAC.80
MVSSSSSSSEIPTAKDLQQNALSVQLTANNFELTPPLKEHTLRAVEAPLSKFSMMTVQRVDVHLSVIKHHQPAKRSRAEVTVIVDGNTLRRAEESDDMYAAVDMLSHSIRRALGKLKRKQGASSHQTFVKDALNGQEYADLDAGLADEDEVEVVQEEVELEWPKVRSQNGSERGSCVVRGRPRAASPFAWLLTPSALGIARSTGDEDQVLRPLQDDDS